MSLHIVFLIMILLWHEIIQFYKKNLHNSIAHIIGLSISVFIYHNIGSHEHWQSSNIFSMFNSVMSENTKAVLKP